MFHGMLRECLFISPDIDGYRASKICYFTACNISMFTICLLIRPDLEGYRAPNMNFMFMFHDMFVSRYVSHF